MTDEPEALNIQTFRAGGFHFAATSTEILVMITSMVPGTDPSGQQGAVIAPSCAISLSPQAAKELAAVLTDGIEGYEKEHGPLRTAWLDARSK